MVNLLYGYPEAQTASGCPIGCVRDGQSIPSIGFEVSHEEILYFQDSRCSFVSAGVQLSVSFVFMRICVSVFFAKKFVHKSSLILITFMTVLNPASAADAIQGTTVPSAQHHVTIENFGSNCGSEL
jgi:hypothetical protein